MGRKEVGLDKNLKAGHCNSEGDFLRDLVIGLDRFIRLSAQGLVSDGRQI